MINKEQRFMLFILQIKLDESVRFYGAAIKTRRNMSTPNIFTLT